MPKKVKFFSSDYLLDLETQVNEFLEEIDHYNIIDIKYNTCIGEESSSNYGQMIYTVMVMYDKEEYPTKSVPEGFTSLPLDDKDKAVLKAFGDQLPSGNIVKREDPV